MEYPRDVKPMLELVSRVRLMPEGHTGTHPRTIPLSILDHTTARFALTSAVWYFDKPTQQPHTFSAEALSRSIRKTLDAYPHWAGQLHWIPYDPARGQRHGRVCITFGAETDPGVELIVARSSQDLTSILPDSETRGTWYAHSFPSEQLLCPTELALHNTSEYAGRHSVSVQVTAFACGGTSITLRLVHPIADATSMFHFVNSWTAVHRALLDAQPLPTLAPLFDPTLLDMRAAGDINSPAPDPELIRISRSLPMAKYDWWASAPGCPPPMLPSTAIPAELAGTDFGPLRDPAPWASWDISVPVSHHLVYFTPAEVQRIWEAASADTSDNVRLSRLDALLAHFWRHLVRARGLERDPAPHHFIVTVGVRARVAPPLPAAFIGSPIVLVRASLPGTAHAGPAPLGTGAAALRAAIASLTPETLGAYLHDVAHEVNPQRFWSAFLGTHHAVATSWLGLDPYGVDFGSGAPPRYVDAVMPNLDGCVHVMEAGPKTRREAGAESGNGRWYDEPVCLSLHIAAEPLEKLLKDPEFRKYRYP
ncbi:transferase family-domain-containing protein [Lenzites betulinus]|nr:transferase family-domain-containing protein [Lenzites betulinus]